MIETGFRVDPKHYIWDSQEDGYPSDYVFSRDRLLNSEIKFGVLSSREEQAIGQLEMGLIDTYADKSQTVFEIQMAKDQVTAYFMAQLRYHLATPIEPISFVSNMGEVEDNGSIKQVEKWWSLLSSIGQADWSPAVKELQLMAAQCVNQANSLTLSSKKMASFADNFEVIMESRDRKDGAKRAVFEQRLGLSFARLADIITNS